MYTYVYCVYVYIYRCIRSESKIENWFLREIIMAIIKYICTNNAPCWQIFKKAKYCNHKWNIFGDKFIVISIRVYILMQAVPELF